MGFEELLHKVGGFGPFQLRNVALLALPRVLLPMHFLLPIFLAAVPAHRCALPGVPANFSHQDEWLEAHLPREPDGRLSSCLLFTHLQALPNTTLWGGGQSPGEQLEGEPSTVPCPQGWEYDHSEFSSTIATEWDLVCEQKGLNRATSTFFFAGVLVGAVAFGYLSDRFGRRRLLLVAYVSSLVLGLASAASVSYTMFAVTRTLTGTALAGFTIIVMPLELEWLDVGHRTVAGVLSSTFWTGGVMLLALVGYLIRDWRWLLLAVTLPCAPGILSIWWVPESARWLLTQGRVEEAHRYLLRCARLNGRPLGEDGLSQEALSKVAAAERVVRTPSYLDLFRTPRLRHISLCCMVVWVAVKIRSRCLGYWHVLHTQKGLWGHGRPWAAGSEGGGDGPSKRPRLLRREDKGARRRTPEWHRDPPQVWSELFLLRREPGCVGTGAERVPDAAALRGRGAALQASGLPVGAPRRTPPHAGRNAARRRPRLGLQAVGVLRGEVLEHRPGGDGERFF
ncbi:solute carrier family 22 member 7 isoform X2 [Monodon monoceros]|uniref:solute carrier family 22 member 7 isoform X2 n=1 Tax=Monodon monoceros TaxID=40151 RepID=UPI0010F7FAED|nr:solute carrier family 22 member 7 isoform X2 [Monodon monoceros]